MAKYKKLSEESDRTLLIDHHRTGSVGGSYREMVFISWVAGWFYLDIYRNLLWFFLVLTVLGGVFYLFQSVGTYDKYVRNELKRRGYS